MFNNVGKNLQKMGLFVFGAGICLLFLRLILGVSSADEGSSALLLAGLKSDTLFAQYILPLFDDLENLEEAFTVFCIYDLVKGFFVLLLGSWLLYGFGELVENSRLTARAAAQNGGEKQSCCGGCGKVIEKGSAFCPHCGRKA